MSKEPREVILAREQQVWALRQQLWTHERIATALQLDRSTVTKILGRLSARYAKSLADQVDAVKGAQIAALEHLADEAMQAWERSKLDAETTTTKTVSLKGPGEDAVAMPAEETTLKRQGQTGNPAHLAEVRGALADIRKILGLDAPTKQEHTGKDGGPIEHTQLTDEERAARLAALLDAARARRGGSPAGATAPVDPAAGAADGGVL